MRKQNSDATQSDRW